MTLVHFHLTDSEGSGLSGGVSLVPTRRVTVRDATRLPVAQTVKLTAGEATMEVMPSTTQWVWRASELVAAGAMTYDTCVFTYGKLSESTTSILHPQLELGDKRTCWEPPENLRWGGRPKRP